MMKQAASGTPMGKTSESESSGSGTLFSPRTAAAATLSSFSQTLLTCPDEEITETLAGPVTAEKAAPSVSFAGNLESSFPPTDSKNGSALSLTTALAPHEAIAPLVQSLEMKMEVDPLPTSQQKTTTTGPSALAFKPKQTHPADHSFVTPTPSKKPRSSMVPGMPAESASYDRKRKSLGALAVMITEHLSSQPPGTIILVDEMAKELLVERRRIYDVINILESVYMVTKHAKNTYVWLTASHLPQMLALLQQEALKLHASDAQENGLLAMNETNVLSDVSNDPQAVAASPGGEAKSLCRLSQQFLHVFLVGNEAVSLAKASDKISGKVWTEEELAHLVCKGGFLPQDPKELSAMAAKGLKTKIRRLYDVGNVLTAIGILAKLDERYWSKNSNAATRPMYTWSYTVTPRDLLTYVYPAMPDSMKQLQTPGVDGVRLSMQILKTAAPESTEPSVEAEP